MDMKFMAIIESTNDVNLICIPESIDALLPSRGIVEVTGTIDEKPFNVVLEPDGMGCHFILLNQKLYEAIHGDVGKTVHVELVPIKIQSEVRVPDDLMEALVKSACDILWNSLTVQARWEWVRWIRSTAVIETRNKRIDTAISMLRSGKKRPCCFDHSRCTLPEISKSGVLQI